jgi:DNA-binding Xre family transcriptional regulator
MAEVVRELFRINVVRLMGAQRWRLDVLAERVELSEAELVALIDGELPATVDDLAALADAFDVDPAALLRPANDAGGLGRQRALPS